MKLILALSMIGLFFGTLPAIAGHEVNNGALAAWSCRGTGYLKGTAGVVSLPFELRISTRDVELKVLNKSNSVIHTEKLFLSNTTVNYSTGAAELRSYKPSNTLIKDLAAYITIDDIEKVLNHPHSGTVDFLLNNGVRFFADTMECKNYF